MNGMQAPPSAVTTLGHAMNKSTPLSSLPTFTVQQQQQQQQSHQQHPGAGDPSLMVVNDTHRQIIAQAQQAAQNYTLPQPSTHDVYEDDTTIQEALASIHAASAAASAQQQAHAPPLPHPLPFAAMQPPPSALPPGMMLNSMPPAHMVAQGGPSCSGNFIDDAWVIIAGVAGYLIASFLPVNLIVDRFAALASVPYASVLLRASIIASTIFVALRFKTHIRQFVA